MVPSSKLAFTLLTVYLPLFSVFSIVNVIVPSNDEYSSGGLTSLIVIISGVVVFVIAMSFIGTSPFSSVSTCVSVCSFTFTPNIAPPRVSPVIISSLIILKLYEPSIFVLSKAILTVFIPDSSFETSTLPCSIKLESFGFTLTVSATYFPPFSAFVIVNVIGVLFSTYPSGAVISVIVIVSLVVI